MRFILTIAISVIATSAFGSDLDERTYFVKLVAHMSDGKFFGGDARCKRNSYCSIRFGSSFGMDIIYRDNDYTLFVIDYDRYSLPCCSFSNGKGYASFDDSYTKKNIYLYQSADDDLVYRKRKFVGSIYISISKNSYE